jgi:hypothetical protein
MSLLLTPSIEKPSNILGLPNQFIRPAFERLYGFDVPQEEVIDGAIFTEASEPLTTELKEILLFEPA